MSFFTEMKNVLLSMEKNAFLHQLLLILTNSLLRLLDLIMTPTASSSQLQTFKTSEFNNVTSVSSNGVIMITKKGSHRIDDYAKGGLEQDGHDIL